MEIIEQSIIPKSPAKKCEDGIVITRDYIAVIDGSTSKTDRRFSFFRSNGRYCMQLVSRYICHAKGTLTCRQFCNGVTTAVARHYSIATSSDSPSIQRSASPHPPSSIAVSTARYG